MNERPMIRSIGRWKKDTEAAACEDCQCRFGIVTRRHHCRSCGGIFCGSCSANNVLIPVIDAKKAQRVCKNCHNRLGAAVKIPPSTPKRACAADPVAPPPAQQQLVESRSGETDSESTRRNTIPQGATGNDARADADRISSDEDDDDGDLGPPRIDLNSMPHHSTHSLSFLNVLQDSLKERDADNIVSVLIYAGEGKEQSMVTDVWNWGVDETCSRQAGSALLQTSPSAVSADGRRSIRRPAWRAALLH